MPESGIPERSRKSFCFYGSHSGPFPLTVFPAHFFLRMLLARSTQDKRHRSRRIFYLCNPFGGNVQILLQIAVLFAAQKLHGSAARM